MDWKSAILLIALCFSNVEHSVGYVEAVGASLDAAQSRSEMQVAMVCDQSGARYHNQYVDASGHWVTDLEHNKGCMKSKSDILDYCKIIYPGFDFLNVAESAHSHLIEDWCKVGRKKCEGSFWVKPFRCLQGGSDADSLSVPEDCRFDQVRNVSHCWEFHRWSRVADKSCKSRDMELYSILTQYPCGSEVYNGAEFVCCPQTGGKMKPASAKKDLSQKSATNADIEDITVQPEEGSDVSTRDPYFTKFDPRVEHGAFKAAERRLEASYRAKITKIMKEWNELEVRYQKLKYKNPQKADKFKLRMTERFNKMMNALKDQGAAEKHQLVDLHQQRIIAHINERKKDGMKCFVRALNERPQTASAIKKCLTHLIRALHKDRHHTISHYNHLKLTNPSAAHSQQAATVEHLQDVQRMVNESLEMMDHYPDMKTAVLPDILTLAASLRGEIETPAELRPTTPASTPAAPSSTDAPREAAPTPADPAAWDSADANRIDIDVEVERRPAVAERRVEPVVAHARVHENAHGEASFLVVQQAPAPRGSRGLYLTVALASLALTVALVGGAVALRRRQRAPHRQGFIEVDQLGSQEDRHLAQMQVNGYENPTYRYFESK